MCWRCSFVFDWPEWFNPKRWNWLSFRFATFQIERTKYAGNGYTEILFVILGVGLYVTISPKGGDTCRFFRA